MKSVEKAKKFLTILPIRLSAQSVKNMKPFEASADEDAKFSTRAIAKTRNSGSHKVRMAITIKKKLPKLTCSSWNATRPKPREENCTKAKHEKANIFLLVMGNTSLERGSPVQLLMNPASQCPNAIPPTVERLSPMNIFPNTIKLLWTTARRLLHIFRLECSKGCASCVPYVLDWRTR
eukprot:gene21036-1158_t